MVGVFDTYIDQSNLTDSFSKRLGKKLKRQFPKFGYILGKFKQDPGKTLAYQMEYVKKKIAPLLVYFRLIEKPADKDLFLDHAERINDKHEEAFNKYKLTPYNGTIDLFRVKERMYYFDDLIYLGWKPYVKGELNVHDTPGNHETFLQEPNVRELSKLLGKILNDRNGYGE
jgi:thioesterase domain-containing protein